MATVPFILIALASSPSDDVDSSILAKKIKDGDHQAFEQFFDLHYDRLFRFLISKKTSPDTAKDLIQKAFIYIWKHRSSIKENKSLRAYLFKIAYTRMLNHHRNHKKFTDEQTDTHQQTCITPEDKTQADELKNAIDKAIQKLPEKRGTVFRLCFLEDFTYKEAADMLGVSPKTIENHMGLAFKDIRESLKAYK